MISPEVQSHSTPNSEGLQSANGMGRDIITKFLDGVPGINENTVKQQLASLKASGDYARIIGEVRDEIEQENRKPR